MSFARVHTQKILSTQLLKVGLPALFHRAKIAFAILVVTLPGGLLAQSVPITAHGIFQAGQVGDELPVGAALFSLADADGNLIWEAVVQAVTPIRRGRIFVDEQGVTRSAIAFSNTGLSPVTLTLTLMDEMGIESQATELALAGRAQVARFVDELFPNLPVDFLGSLTFETAAESDLLFI